MIFSLEQTTSDGILIEKVAYVKGKDTKEAFENYKKIAGDILSKANFYTMTELSEKESSALIKKLKKSYKKAVALFGLFEYTYSSIYTDVGKYELKDKEFCYEMKMCKKSKKKFQNKSNNLKKQLKLIKEKV